MMEQKQPCICFKPPPDPSLPAMDYALGTYWGRETGFGRMEMIWLPGSHVGRVRLFLQGRDTYRTICKPPAGRELHRLYAFWPSAWTGLRGLGGTHCGILDSSSRSCTFPAFLTFLLLQPTPDWQNIGLIHFSRLRQEPGSEAGSRKAFCFGAITTGLCRNIGGSSHIGIRSNTATKCPPHV